MGQYQQWLHYQEIDKQLTTQVEAFEAELARLQTCLDDWEQQPPEAVPLTNNPILQALTAHLSFQHLPLESNANYTSDINNSSASGDSLSPALLSWGGLPNFEQFEIKEHSPGDGHEPPFIGHAEIELLPEDMIAFLDGIEHTDPQLELPWWLRNITISSKDKQAGRPIDQNSIRTNRLVQRWIERWGRQPSTVLKSTEKKEADPGE